MDSDSGPMDSDSDSGPMDLDSHLMDSDSGLMDSDSDSGLVDSDSLLDSRVRTESLQHCLVNWIREHHSDWASSPFSYPELLAYLLFVYHIMLSTFIYCDFFVFAIIVDDFYF